MKNLIYFVVGCAPDYVDLLEFSLTTLCMTNALHNVDILVICDNDYVKYVKKVLPWVNIHITENNPTPVHASIRKVEIFDYEHMNKYNKVLYLDCDIIVKGDISAIFDIDFLPDYLYVKTESLDLEMHQEPFFCFKPYTKSEMKRFHKHQQHVFNCGQFAFLNTPQNKRHFENVRDLIVANSSFVLYEQPFMNYYFNTNFKTDSKPLDGICALLQATPTDVLENLEEEWSNRGEKIIHFINCLQNYKDKLKNMRLFFNLLYSRKLSISSYDTRNLIRKAITLPVAPVIAEIGVFKGEFSKVLLAFNPQMLFLVDPFDGVIMSGDQDGNHVETYQGNTLYEIVRKKYANVRNVTLMKTFSSELDVFDDDTFDMVYIDGDHSYEGVKQDLQLLYEKTKHGGWICGHDLMMNEEKTKNKYDFGVKQAVTEFCVSKGLAVDSIFMDGCVSYSIKVFKVKSYRCE